MGLRDLQWIMSRVGTPGRGVILFMVLGMGL